MKVCLKSLLGIIEAEVGAEPRSRDKQRDYFSVLHRSLSSGWPLTEKRGRRRRRRGGGGGARGEEEEGGGGGARGEEEEENV